MYFIKQFVIFCQQIERMGCCCLAKPQAEDNANISQSRNHSKDMYNPPIDPSAAFRQSGKKYYNSKQYAKAVDSYENALKSDPRALISYSNLALALKADNRLLESIRMIDKMLQIPCYEIDAEKKVNKGRIIKARCQTILAKNFCVLNQENQEKAKSLPQAKQLINDAVQCLKKVVEFNSDYFNAGEYLKNAGKVKEYLTYYGKKDKKNDAVFEYFGKRLESEEAQSGKGFDKVSEYVDNSLEILSMLEVWRNAAEKLELQGEEQQQFTIDPITYDQFQNPIILPSGLSYEKEPLIKHYHKNGYHDPITRQEFYKNQAGVENKTLARYVQETKNPVNRDDLIFTSY